jgi:hypothetical protein
MAGMISRKFLLSYATVRLYHRQTVTLTRNMVLKVLSCVVMKADGSLVDSACDQQQFNGQPISAVCQVGQMFLYTLSKKGGT